MAEPEHWYVEREGRTTGPFTLEKLRSDIVRGTLRSADRVRAPGTTTWTAASKIPQLVAAASAFVRGTANEPVTTVMPDRADDDATHVMLGPGEESATSVMAGPGEDSSTSVMPGLSEESAPGMAAGLAAKPSVIVQQTPSPKEHDEPIPPPRRAALLLLAAFLLSTTIGTLAGYLWNQRHAPPRPPVPARSTH